jgi:hypothetical protein
VPITIENQVLSLSISLSFSLYRYIQFCVLIFSLIMNEYIFIDNELGTGSLSVDGTAKSSLDSELWSIASSAKPAKTQVRESNKKDYKIKPLRPSDRLR